LCAARTRFCHPVERVHGCECSYSVLHYESLRRRSAYCTRAGNRMSGDRFEPPEAGCFTRHAME
jgi:hypothetical protein